MLTQERLRELLDYDPETGVFTWKAGMNNNVMLGDKAGWLDSATENLSYIRIEVNRRGYRAHRLAFLYMTGEWPNHVDHIDGDGLNNAWANLRSVDRETNLRNAKLRSHNKSGYPGIHFCTRSEKWVVRIGVGSGRRKSLGSHDSLLDAVAARKRAEREYDYHENHGRKAA